MPADCTRSRGYDVRSLGCTSHVHDVNYHCSPYLYQIQPSRPKSTRLRKNIHMQTEKHGKNNSIGDRTPHTPRLHDKRPRARLPGSLGRPIVGGGSLGRRPSGYAAPGDAVAAPGCARASPGGRTLQHLPRASCRRKPPAAPCRPRGAVPRVMALHGVAGDVPAREVGEERAREKASERQGG